MKLACVLFMLLCLGCSAADKPTREISVRYELVDSTADISDGFVVAVSESGVPHIAYLDWAHQDPLRLAYRPDDSWVEESVPSDHNSRSVSLVLDKDGVPFISYQEQLGSYEAALRLATPLGGSWNIQTVDKDGVCGSFSSMSFQGGIYPAIAYFVGYPYYDLRYAVHLNGTWSTSLVDSTGESGYGASMVLDGTLAPVVVYARVDPERLRIARRADSAWALETLAVGDFTGPHLATVLDGRGIIHVAYRSGSDFRNTALAYGTYGSSGWTTTIVDDQGDTGYYPSLALDADGNPWVACGGDQGERLYYRNAGHWDEIPLLLPDGKSPRDLSLSRSHKGKIVMAIYSAGGSLYFGEVHFDTRATNSKSRILEPEL
jgi:hypothetical protein